VAGLSPYAMIRTEPASNAIPSDASSAKSCPTRVSNQPERCFATATGAASPSVATYATASFAPPSIPTPMASGGASGGNSPVIFPSYRVTIRSESA
jgi:hypothetical protein